MPVTRGTAFFTVAFTAKEKTELETMTGPNAPIVQAALNDPEIAFDGNTLLIGLDYRTLAAKHMKARPFLRIRSIEEAMDVATPLFKARVQRAIDDARDEGRRIMDPSTFVEPPQPVIDPEASGKDAAKAILANSPGLVLGREHTDEDSINIAEALINADPPGTEILFVEEFGTELQNDITAFLDGPADAVMSDELKKRIADLKSKFFSKKGDGTKAIDWEPLLIRAKQNGVKIYGIDNSEAEPGVDKTDPRYGERRAMVMNKTAYDVIQQARAQNPGKKFVVMTGEAHLNSHPGGVPGLSQMLGLPAVRPNKDGKLRVVPDDKTLRGMPSALEQEFIDACIAKAVKAYADAGGKDPDQLHPEYARELITSLARSFSKDGLLTNPGDVATRLGSPIVNITIAEMCQRNSGRDTRRREFAASIKAGDMEAVDKALSADPYLAKFIDEAAGNTTFLHLAMKEGKTGVALLLIERGANPNAVDHDGESPIHAVCRSEKGAGEVGPLLDAMLAAGGDLAMPGPNGESAYRLACDREDTGLLESIVASGTGTLRDLFVSVFEAKAREAYELSRDPQQHEPFNKGELRRLAEARYDAITDKAPIAAAGEISGRIDNDRASTLAIMELIKLTKERKARKRALFVALDGDDTATAGQALADDPLLATLALSEGKTALDMAVAGDKHAMITELIAKGANPKQVNGRGRTALHECLGREIGKTDGAAQQRAAATAKLLLTSGADPNATDRDGQTPLHMAGYRNNVHAIGALMASGRLDPTIRDNRGWTAYDTTLGSTNKEAEKAFLDNNLATAKPPVRNAPCSTVDLLCQATQCNDPADDLTMRKMYEELYAVPELRPMLDLAAAAACNDRNPPKGGLRIFAMDRTTVGELYGQSVGPSGAYDEKVNSLLICTKTDPTKPLKNPLGSLAHEMTHMMAHLVTDDEDTVPFTDNIEKADYLSAIAADMKTLQRLNPSDPAQAFIQERLSGRMKGYSEKKLPPSVPAPETDFKGADLRLLQEHIVSIPQLIANFGPDYVKEHAPNLYRFFESFSAKAAQTLQTDPRFANGRARIDPQANTKLAQRLQAEGRGPTHTEKWVVAKDADCLKVDEIVATLRKEYAAQYGRPRDTSGGKMPETPFSTDHYVLDQQQTRELDKRLAAAKKILQKAIDLDDMPRTFRPDSYGMLIEALGHGLDPAKSSKDMEKALARTSETWVKKAKIDTVKDRIASNLGVSAESLAEAIVLEAELIAMQGSSDDDAWEAASSEVGKKKQKQAIEALAAELGKPENANALANKPGELLDRLSTVVATGGNAAVRVKPPKRVGKRDTGHVSIDVKGAKRAWVTELGTIPL